MDLDRLRQAGLLRGLVDKFKEDRDRWAQVLSRSEEIPQIRQAQGVVRYLTELLRTLEAEQLPQEKTDARSNRTGY